jgi:hypothetical protein
MRLNLKSVGADRDIATWTTRHSQGRSSCRGTGVGSLLVVADGSSSCVRVSHRLLVPPGHRRRLRTKPVLIQISQFASTTHGCPYLADTQILLSTRSSWKLSTKRDDESWDSGHDNEQRPRSSHGNQIDRRWNMGFHKPQTATTERKPHSGLRPLVRNLRTSDMHPRTANALRNDRLGLVEAEMDCESWQELGRRQTADSPS